MSTSVDRAARLSPTDKAWIALPWVGFAELACEKPSLPPWVIARRPPLRQNKAAAAVARSNDVFGLKRIWLEAYPALMRRWFSSKGPSRTSHGAGHFAGNRLAYFVHPSARRRQAGQEPQPYPQSCLIARSPR